jgi:hypothetical protein
MSADPVDHLANALKNWETDYQAARPRLHLQDIHTLRALLARLSEMIERDATGPSSTVTMPDDDAGA